MKTETTTPSPIKGFSKYGIAGDSITNLQSGKKLFCTKDKKYRLYADDGNRVTISLQELQGKEAPSVAEKPMTKADRVRKLLEEGKDDAQIAKILVIPEGYVKSVRRFDARKAI